MYSGRIEAITGSVGCFERDAALHNPGFGEADGAGTLPPGKGAVFSCPYHGWQYRCDGRLAKATQEELRALIPTEASSDHFVKELDVGLLKEKLGVLNGEITSSDRLPLHVEAFNWGGRFKFIGPFLEGV